MVSGQRPNSPLFGKDKMATFERYFVADKATHVENKNPYYDFQNDEQTALRILGEFGLSDSGFIINGHVPVKLGQGESPDPRRAAACSSLTEVCPARISR